MNKIKKSANLLEYNEISFEQWQELIDDSDTASFFQTKACYDFYCSLSFLHGFVYAIEENAKLQALVCGYIVADGNKLKQFFSRRAIIPGGMLISKNCAPESIQSLLRFVIADLNKKAIYIEFRNFNDYSNYKVVFEGVGFVYQSHLNYQIDSSNAHSLFKKLSESKQRQIKQTEKADAICVPVSNAEEISVFYQILQKLYREKINLPLFPLEFFEEISKHSFAKLFVVKKSNQVLGGILCVNDSNTVFEWFVCGQEVPGTNIYPSVMATWTGIKYAAANNFSRFDFMGAGKPNKSYGVREFKAKFGGKLVENGRFLYISNSFLYLIGKSVLKKYRCYSKYCFI